MSQRPPSRSDGFGVIYFRGNEGPLLIQDFPLEIYKIPDIEISVWLRKPLAHNSPSMIAHFHHPPEGIGGSRAFSLVELLVVIAVIAVIAAIAVPNIVGVTAAAGNATRLRNAQTLVSTYNNYAETYFTENGSYPPVPSDVTEAINALAAGVSITNSRLNTTFSFRLAGMTADSVATNKIEISNNQLVFLSEK